jgi:hypothetical protein
VIAAFLAASRSPDFPFVSTDLNLPTWFLSSNSFMSSVVTVFLLAVFGRNDSIMEQFFGVCENLEAARGQIRSGPIDIKRQHTHS